MTQMLEKQTLYSTAWKEDSSPIWTVCLIPTYIKYPTECSQMELVSTECGSQNGPLVLELPLFSPGPAKNAQTAKYAEFIHSRQIDQRHKVTYLEAKRNWVLGLSPNDERDSQNKQKQQPSHCCEHWVYREQMAGPMGQYQAQDRQQKSCKSQVKGEQV